MLDVCTITIIENFWAGGGAIVLPGNPARVIKEIPAKEEN